MKNAISEALNQFKQGATAAWRERSEQERRLLALGALVFTLVALNALLVGPALDGRARLRKEMPALRQEAAEIQTMARQAAELARQTPAPVAPMSQDGLIRSLAAQGMTAQSLGMAGESARVQLSGVPFASLMHWLDALRRDSRVAAQDVAIVAQPEAGIVNATLTLQQLGAR